MIEYKALKYTVIFQLLWQETCVPAVGRQRAEATEDDSYKYEADKPDLHSKFQANQSYIAWTCLKTKNKQLISQSAYIV